MIKKILTFLFIFIFVGCFCSKTLAGGNSTEVSNGYFSFTMPDNTKNTYAVEKNNNGIYIFEKISKKEGTGGFAFGLKIYKNPKDYADMEDVKKIGELTDKSGTLYDMVLVHPREIYYGDGEDIENNYTRLYELAKNIEIKGVNGSKYFKNQGAKGEGLYNEVLKKYIDANKNKKVGYAYYDINSDGIDELFIGKITNGKLKGAVSDIYAMVDRKPMHVFDAGDAKYFVCSDKYLCADDKISKSKNFFRVSYLQRNTSGLTLYVQYMYDTDKDKNNPWFVSYRVSSKDWQRISKAEFDDAKNIYGDYIRFDFIPLNKFQ